jgi:hypothetical protein
MPSFHGIWDIQMSSIMKTNKSNGKVEFDYSNNMFTFWYSTSALLRITDKGYYFSFFLVVLEFGGLTLARQMYYHLNLSAAFFLVLVIFKTGSCELFAKAGFKLWSSW